MFNNIVPPRPFRHGIAYSIIAALVAQTLAALVVALLLWLTAPLRPSGPEGDNLFWGLILATLSIGPQTALVLREGGWKQKLGTVALYAAVSFGVYYCLMVALVVLAMVVMGVGSALFR